MGRSHVLHAGPDTVHWGYFDAALKPALTVDSGDSVRIESVNGQPRDLIGVPFDVLPEHRRIHEACTAKLGPHIVTGPVAIDGAQPGDLLEVRIREIELRQDWGWNVIRPLRGTLPDDFPLTRLTHAPIDRQQRTTTLPFGVTLPLRPFFGVMGVAPPSDYGAISSTEPREHGGNIDNKELCAGTILFLPVHASGALFSAGDGHAVQGDGEVNLTALETSLAGVFEFHVHKAVHAPMPIGLTTTHVITMGFDEDLDSAARQALREMIGLLVEITGWAREDAYMFCSMACDLHVTQLVNGEKGIHAMVDRARLVSVLKGSHPLAVALKQH